ncbi:mas-related G-protein coupled receptor member A4-like [Larimichthys crocea]|uniref:mas-related G-protein coupled receptor member A4-like n=1 Tax=Larimichthys crocea TaxID=215358 RepID=UPI000F5D80B1|nr:mas-related G-protein coupled receptor member A4-like [Larimichthys crocea]XP_027131693.1 mas-related G-protein coupled receptor member A4-like [Larimichthys crocea]
MDFYNITNSDLDDFLDKLLRNIDSEHYWERVKLIMHVVTCIIISIGLPLILVAIYALYSLVRNGQVAPIYVINLLITDLIQLCCMITSEAGLREPSIPRMFLNIVSYIHEYSLLTSVGFMVCVALERYLVVAWPLWYRFRRTIKIPVVVCVVVWVLPLVCLLTFYFLVKLEVFSTIFAILLLLPLPLFIFLLGGTLKALSASTVPSDEKRRIVGVLVLVLLIYTLLFMPSVIWLLSEEAGMNFYFGILSYTFLKLSPLADLFLYVFMRKGIIDKLLASVCCCRMDSNDISRSPGNDDNIHTVSSV